MKPLQLQTTFPAEYDETEPQVIVQATFHKGEREEHCRPRRCDYPGSPPQIELLKVVNMTNGEETDCDDLPGWLQDDFRAQLDEQMREGGTWGRRLA